MQIAKIKNENEEREKTFATTALVVHGPTPQTSVAGWLCSNNVKRKKKKKKKERISKKRIQRYRPISI
jgi:hypothetical protein